MRKEPISIKKIMHILTSRISPLLEILLLPLTLVAAFWFRKIRVETISARFKLTKKILMKIGVFPIRDHFYEPLFNFNKYVKQWDEPRALPNVHLNVSSQLDLISSFSFRDELASFPLERVYTDDFYYRNGSFEGGDAEFYYSFIRDKKPKRIIEIGSGNSTLIALEAIKKNTSENENNATEVLCIEPYPHPWLKRKAGIHILDEKVENVSLDVFSKLEEGDILFIDSSHMVRPEGDVLYELLHILPHLASGVYIHIHDVFTPYLYPKDWLSNAVYFWNEQFFLESILVHSKEFKIIGSLYYLLKNHKEEMDQHFPMMKALGNQPGSFWIQKN